MMIDIAERLRNHVGARPTTQQHPTVKNGAWDMMLEAADEIEQLRQENDKLSEVRGTDQNRFVLELELERAEKVIEAARESHYPRHKGKCTICEALVEYDMGEG